MSDIVDKYNRIFDAVKRLEMTPVVDDDFPEVKHDFDKAVISLFKDYLNFSYVSQINKERALEWHKGGLEEWSPAEWGNAAAGEMGELCNVLKKILRADSGIQQASGITRGELLEKAAQEIGDTFLYLDLIASRLGLSIGTCIRDTFNRVSEREGFPQKID